jgi:hypothetical protein
MIYWLVETLMEDGAARRIAARDRILVAHAKLSVAQAAADRCRPRIGADISQEFFEANRAWCEAAKEYTLALEDYGSEAGGRQ